MAHFCAIWGAHILAPFCSISILPKTGSSLGSGESKTISAKFNIKTKKWDADITGEDRWEKLFQDLTSTFIPAKEILSNAYNLSAAVEKNNVIFDDTYLDIVNSAKIDISLGKMQLQSSLC